MTPQGPDVSGEVVTTESQTGVPDIAKFTDAERDSWLLKGTPLDHKEEKAAPSAPKGENPVPGSEPGSPNGKRDNADTRKDELNREIRDLVKRKSELEAEVNGKKDVKADPPPAPKKEAAKEAPKEPTDPGDFGESGLTWEDHQKAAKTYRSEMAKYAREIAEYTANHVLQTEREAQAAKTKQDADNAAQETQEAGWRERADAVRAEHKDFDAVAFNKEIAINKVMDGFILDSDLGPRILYHLGKNLDLAKEISQMSAYKTAGAMRDIERDLETTSKASTETTDPKAKVAPAPVRQLGGRNSAPPDPLKAAVDNSDFETYQSLANAHDLRKKAS